MQHNIVETGEQLEGIHDTIARCLIEELCRRVDYFRFKTRGGWLIDCFLRRPKSRIIGYRIAQIGFMADEVWFFLHLDGDANVRKYGREDAQALFNLSDPKNSIEVIADRLAYFLDMADKEAGDCDQTPKQSR